MSGGRIKAGQFTTDARGGAYDDNLLHGAK
jgi:hypothetical protein